MSSCDAVREILAEPGPRQLDAGIEAHLSSCDGCRRIAAAMPAVDRALREIVQHPPPVPSFDRIAPAAAAAARSRRRAAANRRRLPFLVTGGIAAAAAFAGAVLLASLQGRPDTLDVGGKLAGTEQGSTAVLESGALVRVDTGEVELLSGSDSGEERLLLRTGSASFEVPKLREGRSLSVQTPDADVRVHGTRFHVTRDGRGTTVTVTEGLVEVQPEGAGRAPSFLNPGESLFIEPLDVYRKQLRLAAQAALDGGRYDDAENELARLLATEPPPVLRAEALALRAHAASALGNRAAAIAQYRASLELLPAGENPFWADNAFGMLAVLLEREDPAAAAAAWRDYLRRFPEGAHASLARTRVDAAP